MFRLLILIVILTMITILIVSIYQIMSQKTSKPVSSKDNTVDEIEKMMSEIKVKIVRAELDNLSGIEGAQTEIENLKSQLQKIQELKEKTKNI